MDFFTWKIFISGSSIENLQPMSYLVVKYWVISPWDRSRAGMPTLSTSTPHYTGCPNPSSKARKRHKFINMQKEEIKLFSDYLIACIKNDKKYKNNY